jgi:hypothetical protein
MKQLNFTITLEEANKIFKALGKEPFQEVYELIGKLNEQANDQLNPEALSISQDKKENYLEMRKSRKAQ